MNVRNSRVLGGLVIALGLLAAACAVPPQPPVPNPAGLRATLIDTGIELAWNPTAAGQANGYDLQVLPAGGSWTALDPGTDATFTFTDVTPRQQYGFRVRASVPSGPPNAWSPSVWTWYVQPTLPVVRIDTDGRAPVLDRDNYVAGSMTIDPNGSSFDAYSGTLQVRGRGNSTWGYPKKPYKLKLDSKSEILGMPSEKDWVLLANWSDKSQMRSWAAGEISRATGLDWTPTYRHVEVILNGEYQGVYNLTEQVEVKSNRVDIEEMEPEDIAGDEVTGGYLLEIDSRLEENAEPGFRTGRNVPVVVKEPDPMEPAQRSYIRNHVQTFEDRLVGPDFTDPVAGYRPYLDVGAYIDLWTVQELTRNGDSYWSSTYFTKERGDDQLRFGPMWDFDRSMGSPVTPRPQPPEGWYARDNGPWNRRLFQDPMFVGQTAARWDQLTPAISALPAQLEAVAATIEPAIPNDEARWNYTRGPEDQVAYLSGWLQTRIDWISAAFDAEVGPPAETAPVVVNEVESDDTDGGPDWVELMNVGDETVDLTGYRLKDSDDSRDDTLSLSLAPGGLAVLFDGVDFDFGLGGGDSVRLFAPDGFTLVDGVGWDEHATVTLGRCPDGTGAFAQNGSATPGAPNDCTPPDPDPDPGPDPDATVRITEWMYSGEGGEFVELTNVGVDPVDLTGWSYDDDNATPGGFDLSGAGVLAAGESVVFVQEQPADFRADWGLCAGLDVLGPYTNNLGRSDQINVFDGDGALVDRLTYGDEVIAGSPRTKDASAWVGAGGLGADDATAWILSSIGDTESSYASTGGDIGSPGSSTSATVPFDPCAI